MKIALIGYGKMGKIIDQLATAEGHEIVLKINKDNLSEFTKDNLGKANVAIEFSRPETAFENVKKCLESGTPVVCGTTAWLDQLEQAKAIAHQNGTALFYASNYSIGVNVFFAMNKYLAKMMESLSQYDVSMQEIHHTQKLDAPSGTAVTLAQGILKELTRKTKWVNRDTRNKEELTIVSKRIDKVPGTHEIRYASVIDDIAIQHIAHSREGFARGAIRAAEWVIGKQGYFEMNDLLGFE